MGTGRDREKTQTGIETSETIEQMSTARWSRDREKTQTGIETVEGGELTDRAWTGRDREKTQTGIETRRYHTSRRELRMQVETGRKPRPGLKHRAIATLRRDGLGCRDREKTQTGIETYVSVEWLILRNLLTSRQGENPDRD